MQKCTICSGKIPEFNVRYHTGKFCSRKCYWKSMEGKTAWNKGKKRWWKSPTEFIKGHTPAHKGGQLLKLRGESHGRWKGDAVCYSGSHHWMKRRFGEPLQCEYCGVKNTEKRIYWSNKDHQYKRERKDWQQLCHSCHNKYDNKMRFSKIDLSLTLKKLA